MPLPLVVCLHSLLQYGLAAMESVRVNRFWLVMELEAAQTQGAQTHLLSIPNLLVVGLAGPETLGVPSLW